MTHRGATVLLLLIATRATAQEATQLGTVTVLAGQFPTGEAPGAVLNSLEIVTTPGAQGDINRALQTLPGVQQADEGNALFVRGGDSFETITLVNGIRYPNATNLNDPAGTFQGTINPFEAQRVDFASGGFGVPFGNALSGVVDLDTLGAPAAQGLTIGGGLGALSLGMQQPIGDDAGFRMEATRNTTEPIFKLNGSAREYPDPPNGHDFAFSGAWEYRPGGELRWFAVEQSQNLGILVDEPGLNGEFQESTLNRLATLSWKDEFGGWSPRVNLGATNQDQHQTVANGVDVDTFTRTLQFSARANRDLSERVELSLGADGGDDHTRLTRVVAPQPAFGGGTFTNNLPGSRFGTYAQIDALILPDVRAVVGDRIDASSLTHHTTDDPRIALAWKPAKNVSASISGGVYHQIPDPYDFVGETGRLALPAMCDRQILAGVQLGQGARLVRVEAYSKDYSNLTLLNYSYLPVPGGSGRAEGCDVLAKTPLPGDMSVRLSYSYVDTRRTDPNTGLDAPVPFDVRHTIALLFDKDFSGWITSAAFRYGSGKPVTPILGAEPDKFGVIEPVYGPPDSERLPPFVRFDLNASHFWRLDQHHTLVVYASITNLFNHGNVYAYQYSSNFSQRQATPSLFKRTIYFGFSLQFD